MRIAIVAEPPRIRSPFKTSIKQASHLMKQGHSVLLVTQQHNLDNVAQVFRSLFTQIPLIELRSVPLLSRLVYALSKTYRTLRGDEIDIDFASMIVNSSLASLWLSKARCERLLCHSTLSPLSILDFYTRSKIKRVLHLHDMPIHLMIPMHTSMRASLVKVVKRFESWVLNKADDFICTISDAARYWREIFGINPKILYPGCDPSPVFTYPKQDHVLSVTRWSINRGPYFLLDLMEHLKSSGLKLVIAGSWQNVKTLKQYKNAVLKRGLQTKVFLVQNLSELELTKLYQGARCFIYPTKSRLVKGAMEAAAHGVPVISPLGSEIWNVFSPGIHGLEVIEGDIDSYTESVLRLKDDGMVRKLGYSIWKRAHECSWDNYISKLEKILE